MGKFINLVGIKFGKLTVLEFSHITKFRQTKWKCKCDCGKEKIVQSGHLRNGHTQSCGCSWYKHGEEHHSWRGHEEISSRCFCGIKANAETRDIPFDVTIKQIWDLFIKQERKCALSGLPLEFRANNGKIKGNASLDRRDSEKGYTIDNVQWVHSTVNCMKWDIPQEEFLKMCKIITNYQL